LLCERKTGSAEAIVIARAHLIIYVRDLSASRDFYVAVFGRPPSLDVPGMIEIELTPTCVLGLMPEAGITRLLGSDEIEIDPSRNRHPGRAEIYIVLDNENDDEDPETLHARALGAGARELSPLAQRDWGHRVAYSLDPDGHVLAFAAEAT
jgi:catechol 2,3-dioxygenase-like lactoylglutathione lyase family enzyme